MSLKNDENAPASLVVIILSTCGIVSTSHMQTHLEKIFIKATLKCCQIMQGQSYGAGADLPLDTIYSPSFQCRPYITWRILFHGKDFAPHLFHLRRLLNWSLQSAEASLGLSLIWDERETPIYCISCGQTRRTAENNKRRPSSFSSPEPQSALPQCRLSGTVNTISPLFYSSWIKIQTKTFPPPEDCRSCLMNGPVIAGNGLSILIPV